MDFALRLGYKRYPCVDFASRLGYKRETPVDFALRLIFRLLHGCRTCHAFIYFLQFRNSCRFRVEVYFSLVGWGLNLACVYLFYIFNLF